MLSHVIIIVSFTMILQTDLVARVPGKQIDSEKVSKLPEVLHLVTCEARTPTWDSWLHPGLLPAFLQLPLVTLCQCKGCGSRGMHGHAGSEGEASQPLTTGES